MKGMCCWCEKYKDIKYVVKFGYEHGLCGDCGSLFPQSHVRDKK